MPTPPLHHTIKSSEARASLEHELGELRGADDLGLFLESLRSLTVNVEDGEGAWYLQRSEPRQPEGPLRYRPVTITRGRAGERARRSFSVWSRTVGDVPEERAPLQAAAAKLPDDWSRVERVTIDVAAESAAAPPSGRYSIALPTVQPTGTGAFVNAPFYGDIDRRGVDFDHDYNEILRRAAAGLSAAVALDLAGGGEQQARHVLDLVAPVGGAAASIAPAVASAIEEQAGAPLAYVPLIQTAYGWAAPHSVRVADLLEERCPLDADALGGLAGFAQPGPALATRPDRVRNLLRACGTSPTPSTSERADLAEAVAKAIPPGGDWDGFWEWARALCDGALAPLRSKRVLLVGDGRRLALDGAVKVFFPPQTGSAAGVPVPEVLAGHVAFLDIPLRQQDVQNAPATRARKALREFESDLTYDAPALVRRVLLPALPDLPVPLGSPEGHLCAAVFRWAVQLYAERSDWSDLDRLPVPCRGGWHPASSAMLGPGWGGLGVDLDAYLSEAGTPLARKALGRLVLPPDHPVWNGGGEALGDALRRVGVVDGLLLLRLSTALSLRCATGLMGDKTDRADG